VAKVLGCETPGRNFSDLAIVLTPEDTGVGGPSAEAVQKLNDDRGIQRRLTEALSNPKYRWRTLGRVAAETAISEEQAADLLRSDPSVRFSRGKSREIIVGLRFRVS
jgi:hypothetical protein